jgi:heptosyltransferase-1
MPRLLIVKTSSLGDIVHNLPAVTDIHRQFPEMQIDWAVEDSFAEIPRLHPAVSEVIPVSLRRWRRGLLSSQTWEEIAACKQRLQDRHYDLVLDSQGLLKSVLIASWAKGPTHGYSMGSGREPLPALFYRHRHKVLWEQQAVVRIRKLAALALGYPLPESPPDYGIETPGEPLPVALPARYVVALHGTSRDSKLWPIEHWIAVGKMLAARGLALVLPWGNTAEQQRAQGIAAQVADAQVLPKLGLRQLANVLGHAEAAIGVDTGLVHLAAALKTPTLALYTDTDPALTGVLGTHPALFLNLGGIGNIPTPQQAFFALHTLKPGLHLSIT